MEHLVNLEFEEYVRLNKKRSGGIDIEHASIIIEAN